MAGSSSGVDAGRYTLVKGLAMLWAGRGRRWYHSRRSKPSGIDNTETLTLVVAVGFWGCVAVSTEHSIDESDVSSGTAACFNPFAKQDA
ncbi:hypothetical protein V7x_26800 [Crateriforma conspicua]|uniref:Uncharacterized protein n=1 Tax=Crateriforma conspicua TaxID=2527996 RepID=A0A5C6FVS0_9PLAN|nr:hypothetical protein V7x_26800 [Crateriforma conspicua]